MFEKFTEKAVNIVTVAQEKAIEMSHCEVFPEHLLLGIMAQKTCLSTKLLSFSGVKQDKLYLLIEKALSDKKVSKVSETAIKFSNSLKEILKKTFDISKQLNNTYILSEHLFIALLISNNTKVQEILSHFNFDIEKNIQTVIKFLDKKKSKNQKDYHPENVSNLEPTSTYQDLNWKLNDATVTELLDKATAKLSTSKYEILGTEQIIQSILEDSDKDPLLKQVLDKFGLNSQIFNEKLDEITNRSDEYEAKQVIFTPNALKTMVLAVDTAKELGSVTLKPEHVLLGLLKAKQGIAYKIIKSLNIDEEDFATQITKPIERDMSETLIILRLAKQETRRLGKNVLGSEMILLGIICEGLGIGAQTLIELGVTLKDVRNEIEKIVGLGDEYNSSQLTFTPRAKKIIETAWEIAKKNKKTKINSEHLLEAITSVPESIAMKVLGNLGVDVIEIKQGIIKLLNDDN